MQQLSWRFTLATTFSTSSSAESRIISVDCHPAPDWESFEQLALAFCEQANLQKIDVNIGADRAQLHFRSEFGDFLLLFEVLCDALWIEPFQSQLGEQTQLKYLYQLVLKNLGKKC